MLDQLSDIRLREVRREPTEPFNVSDILSDRQAGWILDLRSEDADLAIDFGRSIADEETKTALKQAGSYLVVIARTDLWEKIGNGGRELESSLTEPPPKEVLIRHLQSGTSPLKQHHAHLWSNNSEITKELSGLTPVEIVDWSSDIRNEHSIALKESDYIELPTESVENAVQARRNWLEDLLKWHKTNQSPHCRNFILAAAVLDGCRAGEIYSESQNISSFLSEDQEEKDIGQGGPGIYELVDISEAVLKNGDYLTFPKSGYARSIIEYFWVDRMHLRPKFINWLVDTSKNKGGNYDSETFERMGDYILRWSSQRRDIGDLEKILFAWSSNENLRHSAQDLLTAAAFDPEIGRQVRDKMLTWSKSTNTNDVHLQSVIAHACGGPLGTVFDRVMIYRLGHLVESPDQQVKEASLKSFETLWSAEHTRPRIRDTITQWLTGNDPSRREVGLSSFIAIARVTNGFRTAANSQDAQTGEWSFYAAGWKAALEKKPRRTNIDTAFALWMSNALISNIDEAVCTRIIEESIRSSASSGQVTGNRISALTRMLFVWAPASVSDDRAGVRDRIIERASGLDPIRHLEAAPAADKTYD
ncbi:hypothetical protein [Nocardiopsis salina]|uniref:hypothetical protein n=1 Tax=Nocardiopsis salina TaxID=245836 RepID=UPI0012695310|nr:hypothetical protein [Nocardiopsis salina]